MKPAWLPEYFGWMGIAMLFLIAGQTREPQDALAFVLGIVGLGNAVVAFVTVIQGIRKPRVVSP